MWKLKPVSCSTDSAFAACHSSSLQQVWPMTIGQACTRPSATDPNRSTASVIRAIAWSVLIRSAS